MSKFELIEKYLIAFLKDEVFKTGLQNVVVGLSGGIDSAVVAVLAKKAFDKNLLCVLMPSQYSSKESVEDALKLCQKFDMKKEIVPIENMIKAFNLPEDEKLRIGNLSARVRMTVLFDISARERALVLGTSNKSEIMLGYGTIFGDLASAINPIGDMYKSEIFEFASYLGVVEEIIKKPPSADLWSGQSDENELGFSYSLIDEILKDFIDSRLSKDELIKKGHNKEAVEMIYKRVYQNQFKRKPPIIAKLTERSVNHDFLYPRDIKL